MKKFLKWVVIIFVGFIVLAVIGYSLQSPEEKAAYQAKQQQKKAEQAAEKTAALKHSLAEIEAVSASDIARAYNENTVAADQKFKGKKFKVTGTVVDINTDMMGNPYVTLRGGVNQFMEPHFGFEKSDASQLAKLKKGTNVTLACVGKGDLAKVPMSDSCSILEQTQLTEKQDATRHQEATSQQPSAVMEVITAGDLARAYNENTVAADQRFKGKEFKVTGKVVDINTDIMGNPYVTLRGGVNQFMEPHFGFEKSDADQLAKLKKGSKITLTCIGKDDVAKVPMSQSCSLL